MAMQPLKRRLAALSTRFPPVRQRPGRVTNTRHPTRPEFDRTVMFPRREPPDPVFATYWTTLARHLWCRALSFLTVLAGKRLRLEKTGEMNGVEHHHLRRLGCLARRVIEIDVVDVAHRQADPVS